MTDKGAAVLADLPADALVSPERRKVPRESLQNVEDGDSHLGRSYRSSGWKAVLIYQPCRAQVQRLDASRVSMFLDQFRENQFGNRFWESGTGCGYPTPLCDRL